MWLEDDIVELGETGRDFRGYEVGEFGFNGRIIGWQQPQRAACMGCISIGTQVNGLWHAYPASHLASRAVCYRSTSHIVCCLSIFS